jgi:hypothetical protein
MYRFALLVGIACSAVLAAPAAGADTDVDVEEVGPDVVPDSAPDVETDTIPDADASVDGDVTDDTAALGDAGQDGSLDTDAEGDTPTDAAPPEPEFHTLTVGVSLHSRMVEQVSVAVVLEGPEVVEFALDAPGSIDVEVQEGVYEARFEALGFDPLTTQVVVLRANFLQASIFPDTPVTFSGHVALGRGRLSGADIVVSGSRLGVSAQTTSGVDGLFEMSDLPAGIYDVRVSFEGGWPAERSDVDMLGDTSMNFSLPLVVDEREVMTSRSFCSAGRAGGELWMAALGLLALRRRR